MKEYNFDWERYLRNIEMLSVKRKKGLTYELFAKPMLKGKIIEHSIKQEYNNQISYYLLKNEFDLNWLREILQIKLSNINGGFVSIERGELFDICLHILSETSYESLLNGFSISSSNTPFNLIIPNEQDLEQILKMFN